MAENNQTIGTSDMPSPATASYDNKYKVTTLFKNDLEKVLGDLAYVDAHKYFAMIDAYDGVFTAAILHEFISSLSHLPYRIIAPLMKALDVKANFEKYFPLIKE